MDYPVRLKAYSERTVDSDCQRDGLKINTKKEWRKRSPKFWTKVIK